MKEDRGRGLGEKERGDGERGRWETGRWERGRLGDWGGLIVILSWNEVQAKDPADDACQQDQVFPQALLRGQDARMDPSLTLRMTGLL